MKNNKDLKTPLIVDLDGTVIFTDMLHESVIYFLKSNPFKFLIIIFWLSKGIAHLKKQLSHQFVFDASKLPYNIKFINWLKNEKAQGRQIILCTASDEKIANSISNYLDFFDETISSNGVVNLTGTNKANLLVQRFGKNGFDYAGNSKSDLLVWQFCNKAIVVNSSKMLLTNASKLCVIANTFLANKNSFASIIRLMRVHQWLKNILLFVPLIASLQLGNTLAWHNLFFAFIAFSFCASSVYVTNDLLDLESDRRHPRKRFRPLASGVVPIWQAIVLAPLLFLLSIFFSQYVNSNFFAVLMIYFFITCVYSWKLKSMMLVDCITLAMLYTIRIIAGAVAVELSLTFWLLAFAVFLFLSLAYVKRYSEIEVMILKGSTKINGRAYTIADAPLIQTMGVTSGYTSVLVLALYLNSDAIQRLYASPQVIWAAVPVVLFWISWIWMQAHKGKMHDDPLVFAVKDKISLLVGIIFTAILFVGSVGIKW